MNENSETRKEFRCILRRLWNILESNSGEKVDIKKLIEMLYTLNEENGVENLTIGEATMLLNVIRELESKLTDYLPNQQRKRGRGLYY